MRLGAASPETGFAARLEALGRRQLDGLWLHNIVVGSGAGRLALRGDAIDARLVPAYLARSPMKQRSPGCASTSSACGARNPTRRPAQLVFELGAPGLNVPAAEAHP